MKISIGSGGLTNNFNKNYWEVFLYSIEKNYHIHSALDYPSTQKYFDKAFKENIKIKKLIIKIEINKNPLKKIKNIPNQINLILEKFRVNYIDTLQICNNPSSNFINMLFLKKILNHFKKKGIIKNFFLDSFNDFSENLINLIDDDYFEGYIFTLNILQKGVSPKFLQNILESKKKIISIGPFAGGRYEEILKNFEKNFEYSIKKILKSNKLNDFDELNLSFLKSINNLHSAIFEVKDLGVLKKIEFNLQRLNILNNEDMQKIMNLQEKYNSKINY